jgi:serine/threonine protein kinase
MRLLRDVVEGAATAHEHGVLHRDIKPDNVMISGRHAMLTDFGVAKALGAAGTGTRDESPAATALASYATANENRTSADENGAPSEKVTPFRSRSTTLRPSGEARQLSASAGSMVSVTRSTRTSVAWVNRENRSTGAVASK